MSLARGNTAAGGGGGSSTLVSWVTGPQDGQAWPRTVDSESTNRQRPNVILRLAMAPRVLYRTISLLTAPM